ncbi:MAG: hypothetical protein H6724_08230 [Sandaracinus sp.]|nr:hypothetical protein [Sandaracinus sp.]
MRAFLGILVCVALSGCGESSADPCGEVTEASCEFRAFDADCGGEGAPTVGCSNVGCLRFATACMPEEYRAVDCPDTNLCCQVETGPWPWTDVGTSNPGHLAHDLRTLESIAAAGDVWPLSVVVDPSLSVDATSVTCSDTSRPGCAGPDHEWTASTSEYATYRVGRAELGEALLVEVEGNRARALSVYRFDVMGGGGAGSCDVTAAGAVLSVTGTLTIGAPVTSGERPAGRLMLTFDDGATMLAEFPPGI